MTDYLDGRRLAVALRTGQPDELRAAFERHADAMTLLARSLCGGDDVAAGRMVETAWTSVTADFERDRPRGSARAWLFTRLPGLAAAADAEPERDDLGDAQFLPADDPWEGHWVDFPQPWRAAPDAWEGSAAGRAAVEAAVASLPTWQRVVLVLRDLDAWVPAEVGALMGLLPDEQRQLLARARLKVRDVIDPALRAEPLPESPAESGAEMAATASGGERLPATPTSAAESFDLTCRVSAELLPVYLDDELPESQTVRLEQHVVICPGCGTYLDQLRRASTMVSRLRARPDAPVSGGTTADCRRPAPGDSDRVIAYKFLGADRTARFSRVRWPLPGTDDSWVTASAAAETCRRAVHACRATDLVYWLDHGLWRVELVGNVTESATKVAAESGRLLEPVGAWPGVIPAFIADCTAKLAELGAWAEEDQKFRAVRMLRAYLREIAEDTDPASVSYTVAHAADIVGWLPGEGPAAEARGELSPFETERRRQGRWLAARLGLTE